MIRLDADLSLIEGGDLGDDKPFEATVKAAGQEIVITINDPSRLPGSGRRALKELAVLADGLARRGLSVRVDGPKGTIIAFGAVKTGVIHRLVTGSRHLRLGKFSALAPLVRRRKGASLMAIVPPPTTLMPVAPTLARNVRRRITTTHYIPGSGRPRLIFSVGSGAWDGSRPREFELLPDVTRIGSSPDADLQLDGLEPIHAEIRHERGDEYVLYPMGVTGGGRAAEPGGPSQASRVLRTGARVELGTWRLAYYREEFADHGRPHGGRQGGEYSVQRDQPPRPHSPRGQKSRGA